MSSNPTEDESAVRAAAQFATTHWSTVLRAGDTASPESQGALENLCRQYWFPLYAFVRRKGYSPEDAQDLTQSFFASMFQRRAFGRADGRRGRFRTFLLSALQNHLRMERRAQVAMKRGSGFPMLSWDALNAEERYRGLLIEHSTPEKIFERRWAMALFETVLAKLRQEFVRGGKAEIFDRFREHLWASEETIPVWRTSWVQASTDLTEWMTLETVAHSETGTLPFVDAQADQHQSRYYRVMAP